MCVSVLLISILLLWFMETSIKWNWELYNIRSIKYFSIFFIGSWPYWIQVVDHWKQPKIKCCRRQWHRSKTECTVFWHNSMKRVEMNPFVYGWVSSWSRNLHFLYLFIFFCYIEGNKWHNASLIHSKDNECEKGKGTWILKSRLGHLTVK